MRLVLLAAAAMSLVACQPKARESEAPKPVSQAGKTGQDEPGAPAATPVAVKPVTFDALSKTAEAFTGPVSLSVLQPSGPNSAPAMKIEASNGITYETVLVPGGAENAKAVSWEKIFNTKIDFSPKAPADVPTVDLHSVSSEVVPPKAPNGGFCGKEKTSFIAMAIPITTPGGLMMSIAAFKGDSWPPKDDSGLCGVFNYATPH